MKTHTLTLIFLFILLLSGKVSFSQDKKQEAKPQVVLPDSYYKGQEEKRKYAEANKPSAVNTTTLSTFYPATAEKTEAASNPEIMAKSMLNTTNVPADFPTYNSNRMSEKDYESAVYNWFKINPTYRKINK